MARNFDGSNDVLNWGDLAVWDDATVISWNLWVLADTLVTGQDWIMGQKASASHGAIVRADNVNVRLGWFVEDSDGTGITLWGVTNSAITGQWQHLFGSFIANTASGMQLWIDGTEDGNSPVNTTNCANLGATTQNFTMGERNNGTGDFDGKIAEVAFWNRVLTDSEITILSKAYSPLFITNGLIFYAPLIGNYSPEIDIKASATATVTGATAFSHPRIIYPSPTQIRRFTTAAPPAGTYIGSYYGPQGYF